MIPGIQVALGNFKLAFNYLRSQIGIRENTTTKWSHHAKIKKYVK